MIYIIIPVYNRLKMTINCLNCLRRQNYSKFYTVLVDDGSTDGTSKIIGKKFGEFIKILKGDGNLWWTGAINLGIGSVLPLASSKDFILTINNDMVFKDNYLQELINCAKKYPNSLIGSIALFNKNPDKIYFSGKKWNKKTAKYSDNFKNGEKVDINRLPYRLETDMLPGRGTLIPVKVFEKIGLFDSFNFPQYSSDYDFSLRAKKNGYNLLVCSKAIVFSEVNETGINFNYNKPTLLNFIKSFYSIKSANNLKVRVRFAKKHADNWLIYIIFDILRLTGSFIKNIARYYKKSKKTY